jgi:hypothetical protein
MTTFSVELPLFAEPSYQYNASIENKSRVFKFNWNDRLCAWHMDIANDDGTVIVEGIRLVPSYPMLMDYQLDKFDMTGYFVLMQQNLAQLGSENKLITDIPDRYTLFYIFEQES